MGELTKLPNIGKEIERQLNDVGIYTEKESIGAEEAWLKIKQMDASACMHRLLCLEGAIEGIKKAFISDERKAELKNFYNEHKSINKA